LTIPSTDTPRIQECHMLVGHTVCEMVEAGMFPRE
jgi:D-sedoheptulose 7-phosphate isomerase